MIQNLTVWKEHIDQLRPEMKWLVLAEGERLQGYISTSGEYLLPNLWVNRNEGTRAYYELSWHDGHNYHMLATHFADIGKMIDDDEFYNVYTMAVCSALLDPIIPFNLTMCQIEERWAK